MIGSGASEKVLSFYESLADSYHLIFDDWNKAIERQAKVLNQLVVSEMPGYPLKILDCTCGIGTQAIGFATFGHKVVASDLSPAEIVRARKEAANRSLNISFHVSDLTSLAEIPDSGFDVVATLDNALPHLKSEQLQTAIRAIALKLKTGGLFIASIRDYDALILRKPTIQEPAFYGSNEDRRIVHQVWDWVDGVQYVVHLYITMVTGQEWRTLHFVSEYRSLLRQELSRKLESAGFRSVKWLMPGESNYYQPIVLARWGNG